MYSDTITALATPPGIAGLAVVRVSGKDAINILSKCFKSTIPIEQALPNTILHGYFYDNEQLIDEVTASIFKEPKSYTGEDVIEIGCHGGYFIANNIIKILIDNGARLAEPGEFTKRAFLNGKLDLTQVEAVSDLIHSLSEKAVQTATRQLDGGFTKRIKELRSKLIEIAVLLELEIDFFDEDIELIEKNNLIEKIKESKSYCLQLANSYKNAEILRSGYFVAIVGFPNSGKSTLFNSLLQKERAIVSEIPGTTRDYLEETIYVKGIPIKLIDTAGIRPTDDYIEIEGIRLAQKIIKQANLILIINDINLGIKYSKKLYEQIHKKFPDSEINLVQNKIDKIDYKNHKYDDLFNISAKENIGIDKLIDYFFEKAENSIVAFNDVLVNQRQAILLIKAVEEINLGLDAINNKFENEIISIHIKETSKLLGEITGESWNEEVLHSIFSKFCIGK